VSVKNNYLFSVPNLEEEIHKLAGKDGWIRVGVFHKDKVDEAAEATAQAQAAAKKKEMSKSKVGEKNYVFSQIIMLPRFVCT
jgi:hypothetical protein